MHEVVMPKLTHDMKFGILLEWIRGEGAAIQQGEPLFAVETDKAAVTVEAEASGVLSGIRVRPGEEVPIGAVVAYLLETGETAPVPAVFSGPSAGSALSVSHGAESSSNVKAVAEAPAVRGSPAASPIARRIAKERGIDLRLVRGTGPAALIVERDVQALLGEQALLSSHLAHTPQAPYEVVPLTDIQRTAGRRLAESMREIPFFDLVAEIDMSAAARLRSASGEDVSYTAIFLHATAKALRDHPRLNAHMIEGELRCYREINIGVAIATEAGLLVPVVHGADGLSPSQIQSALTDLQNKARAGRFASADLTGGTFTLSNLGMFDVDAFRAIVNPPEVAILAVGRVVDRPNVREGQILVCPMARVTLSADHRALDGATAAPFLEQLRQLLETL